MKHPEIISIPTFDTGYRGTLSVVEKVPFAPKRVFWIYGTSWGALRGGHGHKKLHQLLVPLPGSRWQVMAFGPKKFHKTFWLEEPSKGLYVPPMHWLEIKALTQDCGLLVLASDVYKKNDYWNDWTEFREKVCGKENGKDAEKPNRIKH